MKSKHSKAWGEYFRSLRTGHLTKKAVLRLIRGGGSIASHGSSKYSANSDGVRMDQLKKSANDIAHTIKVLIDSGVVTPSMAEKTWIPKV